jgi:hypothetical protein
MVLLMILACGSVPETSAPTQPVSQVPSAETAPVQTVVVTPAEQAFDPRSITTEQYQTAMAEVQALIEELNRIIRARNYNAWVPHLSEQFLAEISSPAFLAERTEELFRRDQMVAQNMGRNPAHVQRRVLRTSRDYFTHIVVPSRSNDRVDDIDFVSENQVIAYTVDARGNRLILYNLEIIDGRWKIIS